jgi:transcriptional regulator with XRE-family HTH domain
MSSWFRESSESLRALAEERALIEAAELVSEAIEVRRTSRSQLAAQLGIVRSEITQRLSGKRNLTVRSLAAMLHELGYDLQLRVLDRSHSRPVWRSSGQVASGGRYTTAGNEIRVVKSAA